MTNCPNCGAPVRRGHSKCEYCDTPYEGIDPLVLYADNRPVHIEYQAPSGMTPDFLAQQVCESIQNRIHHIESQINVSNTIDWEKRMLEQSVNVFPLVEPKVELIDYSIHDISYKERSNIYFDFACQLILPVLFPALYLLLVYIFT